MSAKQFILNKYYNATEDFVKTVEIMVGPVTLNVSGGLYDIFAQPFPGFTEVIPNDDEFKKFINNLFTFVYILQDEPSTAAEERLKRHFTIDQYSIKTLYFIHSYMVSCVIPVDHPNISLHEHLIVIFVIVKNALEAALKKCEDTFYKLYYPRGRATVSEYPLLHLRMLAKEKCVFKLPHEIIDYARAIVAPEIIEVFYTGYSANDTLDIFYVFEYISWKYSTCIINDDLYYYYVSLAEYLGCTVEHDIDLFITKMHNYLFARIDKYNIVDLGGAIMYSKK